MSSIGDHLDLGVVREGGGGGQGFAGWISCSGRDKSRSRHTDPHLLKNKIGSPTLLPLHKLASCQFSC